MTDSRHHQGYTGKGIQRSHFGYQTGSAPRDKSIQVQLSFLGTTSHCQTKVCQVLTCLYGSAMAIENR